MITRTARDVPAAVIVQALRAGAWSCFCTPRTVNAVRVKVSRAARRAGLLYRAFYEPDRWLFTAYLPIAGQCGQIPTAHERDEIEAVYELAQHARTHIALIRVGASLEAVRP